MDKIFLMGGSYLLNVGPDRDGVIPEPAAEIVRTVGEWYLSVREAFACGAEPEAELKCSTVWASRAGERLYLHTKAPLISTGLSLAPMDAMPKSAVLLNTGEPVKCVLETYPEDYTGTFGVNRPPVLRLRNLPAEDNGMPLVIRLIY